ncbi:MAG: hypothetical protein AAF518_09405 [Spirochaetota bacterium]
MISYNENKELSGTISKAIKENKPISITTYFLNDSGENSLRLIISSILNKFNRTDLTDACFESVKSLVNFASKANMKRAIFKEIGLDIYNPKDYEVGMVEYKKQFNRNNLERFKATIKNENLTIKTTFSFSPETLNIRVRNNFSLLPAERNAIKAQFSKINNTSTEDFTDEPGSSGLLNREFSTKPDVAKFRSHSREKDIFKVYSSEKSNETVIRLEFPLTDKSMLNNELMKIKMDSLLYDYRSQFDSIFHKRLETLDIRTSTLIEDFQRKINRTREETSEILERLQRVGHDLYDKQEDLLSQYGEKVYEELVVKITEAKENTVASLQEFEESSATYLKEQAESADQQISNIEDAALAFMEKQKTALQEALSVIEDTESSIRQRLETTAKENIQKIQETAKSAMQENDLHSENLRKEFDKSVERSTQASLDLHGTQMEAVGKALEEKIHNLSEEVYDKFSAKANGSANELETNITQLTNDSLQKYEKEIHVLDQKLEEKIKKLSTESIDTHKQEVEKFNKILHDRITNQSTILNGQVKLYLEQMERSSMDFLENLNQNYETSMQNFQSLQGDVDKTLEETKEARKGLTEQISTEREKVITLADHISEKISDMEKSKVNVDKVHELVKESELAYGKISDKLNNIQSREEDVNEYLKNASIVSEAIQHSKQEIELLQNQKKEINSMKASLSSVADSYKKVESQAEKLADKVSVVEVIDDRMKTLEKFQTDVNTKLVEVTNLAHTLSNLETALNSQEKKSGDIEGKFERFYKELEFLLEKGNELNQTILDMDEKVSIVNDKTLDIKLMESKFNKIESMMADLSMRHKQIATMERRLEEMKGSMEYILDKADEKADRLSDFLDDVNSYDDDGVEIRVGRKQNSNFSDLMKKLKQKVLNLHEKHDMSAEEIAKNLGVEKPLVDSIIHNIPYYI